MRLGLIVHVVGILWTLATASAEETRLPQTGDDTRYGFDLIPSNERLWGPALVPADSTASVVVDHQTTAAAVVVHADQVANTINPLQIGMCMEDLNHEIYGGLYAQMVFGESFEEAPMAELPKDWRFQRDWLKAWSGLWWAESGVLGMTGFRMMQMVWEAPRLIDGTVECEVLLTPDDPGRGVGLLLRTGSTDYYLVQLSSLSQTLSLWRPENLDWPYAQPALASRPLPGPAGEWRAVKVVLNGGRIRVFVDCAVNPQLDFTDPNPLVRGGVGLDATEGSGQFRNLRVSSGGKIWKAAFIPQGKQKFDGTLSCRWDAVRTGNAQGGYCWDDRAPFNTRRAQMLELRQGKGTLGVANSGLNRRGMNIVAGARYTGRIYLRGRVDGEVCVALQSADGARTHALQRLRGIGAEWSRFSLDLVAGSSDCNARLAIWIDRPGTLWMDQVVLMPTGQALFKGLPVRTEIAKALIETGIKHIRFGGDMTNPPGYRWKTMRGDPDLRPQYNGAWYPYSTRGWLQFEFLAFCRTAGIEPIPILNAEETLQDAADFVEYCNGSVQTRWGALRSADGHPEPYAVRFIQLGNGSAGPSRTRDLADAIHAVDPQIQLLSGAIGFNIDSIPDQVSINTYVQKLEGKVRALSVLPYNDQFGDAWRFEQLATRLRTMFREANPCTTIQLYSQEVNGGLHNWQRALTGAAYLNAAERMGEFVPLVSFCNALQADGHLDNGWPQGLIFFDNRQAWLQPHAYMLQMATRNAEPLRLQSGVECPLVEVPYYPMGPGDRVKVPSLDVVATTNAQHDQLVLKAVNIGPAPLHANVRLEGARSNARRARAQTMVDHDLNRVNTAMAPAQLVPKCAELQIEVDGFTYEFPGYSYTVITLPILTNAQAVSIKE